jgi:opacity protein-like surface antigen
MKARRSLLPFMSFSRWTVTFAVAVVAALFTTGAALAADSGDSGFGPRTQVSLLGGIQALNKNDTAIPDHFVNVPIVANVSYEFAPNLAAEGDFTWLLPVKQSVDVAGVKEDRKTPDILSYQAGLRYSFPVRSVSPYVAAGAGAVTFLSNTDADRVPQLSKSETSFAINFGAGLNYPLSERVGLRADLRELVAFPSNSANGLSNASGADQIWMERGALGLSYRF